MYLKDRVLKIGILIFLLLTGTCLYFYLDSGIYNLFPVTVVDKIADVQNNSYVYVVEDLHKVQHQIDILPSKFNSFEISDTIHCTDFCYKDSSYLVGALFSLMLCFVCVAQLVIDRCNLKYVKNEEK